MSKLVRYEYTYEEDFNEGYEYDHSTFYIGSIEDIKTLYHSIKNAWKKNHTVLHPYTEYDGEFPKLNPFKMYALKITWEVSVPYESMTFDVITADTLCQYMMIGKCVPA